jgi:hypothetical protein
MKTKNKVAFLWDESFLWGLMAYKALRSNNLPFEFIRPDDIKNGCLKNYKMLFVPGGWASNKMKTLGEKGISEIKNFVDKGGNYLGFCGGAGLATLDGIGLLDIKRVPTKQRVPSFSGKIHLNINEHPIWDGLHDRTAAQQNSSAAEQQQNMENNTLLNKNYCSTALLLYCSENIFHAWWPSQFLTPSIPPLDKGGNRGGIKILATYGDAFSDSFSSDLNVGDVEANGSWPELEDIYKINLNPQRLKGTPAVVEGSFGRGKVILSLIHFDTPDDTNGARVLKNLWKYLAGQNNRTAEQQNSRTTEQQNIKGKIIPYENYCSTALLLYCTEIESAVDDLISLGTRNFLWFWRNPMLLQWRRGVRGLEYCTLHTMIKEMTEIIRKQNTEYRMQNTDLEKIKELLIPFTEKAKLLLILERYAMQNRHITPLSSRLIRGGEHDLKMQEMRIELFGNSKSHGGLFKELIDTIDDVLYTLISDKDWALK